LDLHDGVAQHLSLLALRLEGAGLTDTEDATTIKDALANAMTELRAISRGLALPDIDALTISETVNRAVSDHNKAFGAAAKFDPRDETPFQAEPSTKLALYRVTQELLANTQKHAAASKVEVKLDQSATNVTVTVSDNGVGFVPGNSDLQKASGQGLLGIRDRLLPLGGRLEIQSQSEHGTTAVFSLPHEGSLS
jgi:signal transduction histidine kinase